MIVLGCLGWLVLAVVVALGLGRAIRIADRHSRPLGSEQWHPPEWVGTRQRVPRSGS